MAAAVLGEVAVLLFVAAAVFGEVAVMLECHFPWLFSEVAVSRGESLSPWLHCILHPTGCFVHCAGSFMCYDYQTRVSRLHCVLHPTGCCAQCTGRFMCDGYQA